MTADVLRGIRVVECGDGIAVPYCGKLLADFGADIIKVESPGLGDRTRHHGPFPHDTPHPERSGLFLALNTNKRSITLNPETATGRQMLGLLMARADVFVHATPPRQLAALDLTADTLRRAYPR